MRPELVIFDCDGVLVDSEPMSNAVLVNNLARHGLTMTVSQAMKTFVGGTLPGVAETARAMGASLPGDWLDQINAEINAGLAADVEPVDGVVDVLDQLDAARISYCVASNGSDEKMGITLGKTGILPRVEGRIFAALTLGVAKPDPDLFLIAAREMGVAPTNAVVIEDSASGALAAKRAGMRCFGYAPEGGEALIEHGAIIFRDMVDLPALLQLN